MIQGENIQKHFGDLHVLKGVDIHVQAGEVVSVVGPSGAGKTTLLQLLGTLDRAESGVIRVGGVDVSQLKGREQADFQQQAHWISFFSFISFYLNLQLWKM